MPRRPTFGHDRPELLRRTGVPGMAIAVVHDDQVLYAKGFGVHSTETNQPDAEGLGSFRR